MKNFPALLLFCDEGTGAERVEKLMRESEKPGVIVLSREVSDAQFLLSQLSGAERESAQREIEERYEILLRDFQITRLISVEGAWLFLENFFLKSALITGIDCRWVSAPPRLAEHPKVRRSIDSQLNPFQP